MAEDRILAVRFDCAEDFRREYDDNIANGGIFVRTLESVSLRERISVGIEFAWRGDAAAENQKELPAVPTPSRAAPMRLIVCKYL